jgi:hypothetical protein
MARNDKDSAEIRNVIRDKYIFFHMSATAIEKDLNRDQVFTRKYGTITVPGVHYHIQKIKSEYEKYIGEDAIDKYTAEFVRLQNSFDKELEDVDEMIKRSDTDDVIIKLMRLRHEIRLDKMKMLQDIELPLAVKKLKIERNKKYDTLKKVEEPMTLPEHDLEDK